MSPRMIVWQPTRTSLPEIAIAGIGRDETGGTLAFDLAIVEGIAPSMATVSRSRARSGAEPGSGWIEPDLA